MPSQRLFLVVTCLLAMLGLRTPASAQLWVSHYNAGLGIALGAPTVDHAGNVVVTGYEYLGTKSKYVYTTAKFDGKTGRVLWVSHYTGTGTEQDSGHATAIDSHDNVFVTGVSYEGTQTHITCTTIKYDGATGVALWTHHYNSSSNTDNNSQAIVVDSQDNVIVAADTVKGITLLKYAGNTGALLWVRNYSGTDSTNTGVFSMTLDSSDNIYVTGYTYNSADGSQKELTLKYAGATGTFLWASRWDDYGLSRAVGYSLALDHAGNVLVTGGDDRGSLLGNSYLIVKIEGTTGRVLWVRHFDGVGNGTDISFVIATDSQDNVIVSGHTWGGTKVGNELGTLKFDTAGNFLWARFYAGPSGAQYANTYLAVDSQDNIIAAATPYVPPKGSIAMIKYAPDGSEVWLRTYADPQYDCGVEALSLDSQDNIFVTGYVNAAKRTEQLMIKYAP